MIHELTQPWSVSTPKGKATVLLVMDYGFETDTLFLCVLKDTSEFFWFRSFECKMDANRSLGRGDWNQINEQATSAKIA